MYGVTQNNVATAGIILVAMFDARPEYIGYANRGRHPEASARKKP